MKVEIESLIRVSTYARKHKVGITETHRRIEKGTVKAHRIDGAWFIENEIKNEVKKVINS